MNTQTSDSQNANRVASHVAYGDETHHNIGRYRGVGLITTTIAYSRQLSPELERIIHRYQIDELKWGQLRSAKVRYAVKAILDLILDNAVEHRLRADVLTWDIEDSRHKVQGRSDVRNLRRMYYFLSKDVLSKRWPLDAIWGIYLDESTLRPEAHLRHLEEVIDWETGETLVEVNVAEIRSALSHQTPLIQVADLLAGLGVYSRDAYERYIHQSNAGSVVSNSDRERFEVLEYFHTECKSRRLGVSLNHRGGLWTFNPKRPINFWWYEPQGDYDKAPLWH